MFLKRLFGKSRDDNHSNSSSKNSNSVIVTDPRLRRLNELLRAGLDTDQQKLEFLSLQRVLITGPVGYGGSMTEEAEIYSELLGSLSSQEWIDACKADYATPILKGYAASALGRKSWNLESINQLLPFLFDLVNEKESIEEQAGCCSGLITFEYILERQLLASFTKEVASFVSEKFIERYLSMEEPIAWSEWNSYLVTSVFNIDEAPSEIGYSLLKKSDDKLRVVIINRALSCAKNEGKRRFVKYLKKWLQKNAEIIQGRLAAQALGCVAKTPTKFKLEVMDVISCWAISSPRSNQETRKKLGEILDSLLPLQNGTQVFWSVLEKSYSSECAGDILEFTQKRIPDVFRMHEARFSGKSVPPLGQLCARYISQQPARARAKLIESAYASLPEDLHAEIQVSLTAGHNVREISWLAWLKFDIGRTEHVFPALKERTLEELPNQLLIDRIRDSWTTSKLAPELLKLLRHKYRLGQEETASKFAEIVGSNVDADAFPSCVVFSKYEKALFVPVIVRALSKRKANRDVLIQLLENFKATEELKEVLSKSSD